MLSPLNDIGNAGLAAAVDQPADGVIVTGIDGAIQCGNPALTAVSGYNHAELELVQVSTEAPSFDPESLLQRLMDDRGLADTILEMFIEEFPVQLKRLRFLWTAADAAALRLHAHTLKGAAATVSAAALSAIAAQMEHTLGTDELERFDRLLHRLAIEFDNFQGAVKLAPWSDGRKNRS